MNLSLREAELREAELREGELREAELREGELREAELREGELKSRKPMCMGEHSAFVYAKGMPGRFIAADNHTCWCVCKYQTVLYWCLCTLRLQLICLLFLNRHSFFFC